MSNNNVNKSQESFIKQMIRVNHAGEFAAKRIYEGQLKYIKDLDARNEITEMAKSEKLHLEYFEKQITQRQARPTLLHFAVDKIAYALGAVTAKLGTEAAMVCTSAVENVIADHYALQIKHLEDVPEEKELKDNIIKIRNEELDHKHSADCYDLEKAPAYKFLDKTIQNGCKIAIKLVKLL